MEYMMTELEQKVIDLYESDFSVDRIAEIVGISENLTAEIIDEFISMENEADPGDLDGDHESALASVGWGTDEDYGGFDSDW